MRWFLSHTGLGKLMAAEDGVSLLGAHIQHGPGGERFCFWSLSVDSLERQYCPSDVLNSLVHDARFQLRIRGAPVVWQATCLDEVAAQPNDVFIFDPAPIGQAPRKSRADDWMEMVRSADGDFECDSWAWHVDKADASPASGLGLFGLGSEGAPPIID
jgi:hypothetical protein